MDISPIVKAYDHARAAAVATRQASDTTVAINEHTQAAGEFANAARGTSSLEALRTLKLLEDHHRRLAELLNLPPDQPSHQDLNSEKEKESLLSEHAPENKDESKSSQKSASPGQRRIASREMSSSIASNLASARGIRSKYRSQPLSPSVSNNHGQGNVDPHPRRDGSKTKMQNLIDHQPGKPTWIPPMSASPKKESHTKRKPSAPTIPEEAVDDPGYSRFYNTFGSIINRISAPLAFAGLPLVQEEFIVEETQSPEASTTLSHHKSKPSTSASTDPDLSKIYSKETMRAFINDGHGVSDSFYVVPTSGHTVSYANILTYAEKEKRRLGASNHGSLDGEEEDDFVDARETPMLPLSPGAKRRIGRSRTDKDLQNTVEELYTENKSLKVMLDKLTERLHTFEASAQNMAESYRLPMSPQISAGSRSAKSKDEDESTVLRRHIDRLEKDNKKMQKTLEKYREKWETLKAGAKARREAQGGGDSVEESPS